MARISLDDFKNFGLYAQCAVERLSSGDSKAAQAILAEANMHALIITEDDQDPNHSAAQSEILSFFKTVAKAAEQHNPRLVPEITEAAAPFEPEL